MKNEKRWHVKGETDGKYVCQLPACRSQWLTQTTHQVVGASICLARAEHRIWPDYGTFNKRFHYYGIAVSFTLRTMYQRGYLESNSRTGLVYKSLWI